MSDEEEKARKVFEERNTSAFRVWIDNKLVYDPFNNPEQKKMQEQAEAESAQRRPSRRRGRLS
jgi:hypothetical protein